MAKGTTKKASAKTADKVASTDAKKAATKEQFAEADARGDPALDEIAAGLAVRGY